MTELATILPTNYIGGEWINGAAATSTDITNPATAETLATIHLAEAADVGRAAGRFISVSRRLRGRSERASD